MLKSKEKCFKEICYAINLKLHSFVTPCSFFPIVLVTHILHSRLERDSKLSALEERADALQDGSAQFEKRAASLKNKFWLENLKSMIAMGVVGVILLGLLYWKFFANDQPQQPMYYQPPPPQQQPAAPAKTESESSGAEES